MSQSFEINGVTYETTEDGFLKHMGGWNRKVAKYLARQDGIKLSNEHWEVINFLREYYDEYKIAPMIRILVKAIQKKLGKKWDKKRLYDLFPAGPAKMACKYAGLPKPTGCV